MYRTAGTYPQTFGPYVRRPRVRLRAFGLLSGTATGLQRRLQVALGVLWLVDAALQYQPFMFHRSFVTQVIEPNAVGQPGLIGDPITWIAHLIEPRVALFNAFAATVQLLIGLGLIYRRTVKLALLASFGWAAGIWFMGEGFGMLLTGTSSPLTGAPGAVLLRAARREGWPREHRAGASTRRLGLLDSRAAKMLWAGLWLGSAALWLQPANLAPNAVHDAIARAPSGAGWLTTVQHAAASAAAGNGVAIAIALASISAVIGLGVFSARLGRDALVAGAFVGAGYWLLGEGLGGIFTGSATDPNTGPLLVLLAVTLQQVVPRAVSSKAGVPTGPAEIVGARLASHA